MKEICHRPRPCRCRSGQCARTHKPAELTRCWPSDRCPSNGAARAGRQSPEAAPRHTPLASSPARSFELAHASTTDALFGVLSGFDVTSSVPSQNVLQPAWVERGARGSETAGGTHPTACPPDAREQPLQLLQDRRDLGPRRLHQARHREDRHALHARRADRRRRLQGRRDAARHLRDPGRGPRRGAQEAEHDAASGRCRPDQHRLAQALRQGQRQVRQDLPRHRRKSRAIPDQQGPDDDRRRQLAGGGGAKSGPAALAAHPPAGPGGEWRAPPGESQARRAGGQAGLRVRFHDAAHEDQGGTGSTVARGCANSRGSPLHLRAMGRVTRRHQTGNGSTQHRLRSLSRPDATRLHRAAAGAASPARPKTHTSPRRAIRCRATAAGLVPTTTFADCEQLDLICVPAASACREPSRTRRPSTVRRQGARKIRHRVGRSFSASQAC